jgi:diguanylate cyclase (GGDEF)-like protein/PAS domain S-box-containing protein
MATSSAAGAVPSTIVAALSSPDRFTEILDNLSDAVYIVDRARTVHFWNRACERITGYGADEVIGRRCFDEILRHVDQDGRRLCVGLCPLAHTMGDGVPRETRLWLHHKRGHRLPVQVSVNPIRDPAGQIVGAIETFTDDSTLAATRERVEELERLAMADALTGVPNRRFMELTLRSRLAELRRHGVPFVLGFADIDNFKHVNDNYGHAVGDAVLRMVATTLAGDLRGSDTLARFGGEEFVLLLHHIDADGSLAVCERLRKLVAASSIDTPTGPLTVTISFGATLADQDDSPEILLNRGDQLLYLSKRGGGDRTSTDLY